jgi:hypothetical protein
MCVCWRGKGDIGKKRAVVREGGRECLEWVSVSDSNELPPITRPPPLSPLQPPSLPPSPPPPLSPLPPPSPPPSPPPPPPPFLLMRPVDICTPFVGCLGNQLLLAGRVDDSGHWRWWRKKGELKKKGGGGGQKTGGGKDWQKDRRKQPKNQKCK